MDTWTAVRDKLRAQTALGFDLEGDFNLHRYGRRVCLFQLALPDGDVVLLDPLQGSFAEADWPEFRALLEDPAIAKVIWAAQNDVRALKFCHGIHLRGLFDLFDAARMTGLPRPSLPLLVERHLGLALEKSERWQTSDWNRRPLEAAQLAYAAADVRYLLPLAEVLRPLLVEKKQAAAFAKRMESVEAFTYPEYDAPWLKMKGSGALSPGQQLALKDLWLARERQAEASDVAPWKVLANEALLDRAREAAR